MNISLGDVITFIIAVGGLFLAWRKAPLEGRKLAGEASAVSADAAAKFQEIAAKAAEREEAMRLRMDELESKMDNLETQLRKANERAAKFEGWAKRLAHQVQSLGGVPVPLELEDKK
jgi:ribosome-associated translation inhibitor RaiA